MPNVLFDSFVFHNNSDTLVKVRLFSAGGPESRGDALELQNDQWDSGPGSPPISVALPNPPTNHGFVVVTATFQENTGQQTKPIATAHSMAPSGWAAHSAIATLTGTAGAYTLDLVLVQLQT